MKKKFIIGLLPLLLMIVTTIAAQGEIEPPGESEFKTAIIPFLRGRYAYAIGENEIAIAYLTLAIELNPEFTSAFNTRGMAYAHMGEYFLAIADHNRALSIDPDYVYAHFNLGVAYFALGQYERAIENYTTTIELDPDYANAYWGRGSSHHMLNQCQDAIANYRAYERLSGELLPFMAEYIDVMEGSFTCR